MNDEPEEFEVETLEGTVYSHSTKVDPNPQEITVITGDELAELQSLSELGPPFVAHYFPEITEPTLKDYDAAFYAWQKDTARVHSEQQVIEIVGGYLGNKLAQDLDMQWVTVTDEYGTDYAVQGTQVELMSFPFSTVLKRIEDEEHDFVHGVYYTVKDILAKGDLKAKPDASSK